MEIPQVNWKLSTSFALINHGLFNHLFVLGHSIILKCFTTKNSAAVNIFVAYSCAFNSVEYSPTSEATGLKGLFLFWLSLKCLHHFNNCHFRKVHGS